MRPLWLACATLFAFAFSANAQSPLPVVVINNGLAPPNPANVIDATNSLPDNSLFVRDVGCTNTVSDPPECGGPPTTVSVEAGGEVGGDVEVNRAGEASTSSLGSSVVLNGGRIGGDLSGSFGPVGSPLITITDGEVVGRVFLWGSGVLMSGGTVGKGIGVRRGGATITGGTVGYLGGEGVFVLLGGSVGDAFPCCAYGSLSWHGGTITGTLEIRDAYRVEIFGRDFAIDGVPVPYGSTPILSGLITGTLEDGTAISTAFTHNMDYQDSRLVFTQAPEPSAVSLGGAAVLGLALRSSRRSGRLTAP